MYIRHAQNLVQAIPYSQTGYIYNPDAASYGPPAYPPVFPLLLAPLVACFGVNLLVLKIPGIISFTALLLLLTRRILKPEVDEWLRVLLVILTGFAPCFFFQSERIYADLVFVSLTFFALYFTDKCLEPGGTAKQGLLAGLFIYLSFGTRTVGFMLIPVALLLYFLRKDRNPRALGALLVLSLALMLVQSILITGTGSYFDQMPAGITAVLTIALRLLGNYVNLFIHLIETGNDLAQYAVFLFMLEGFLLGMLIRNRQSIFIYTIFFFVYFGSLLSWPSYQGYRFLLPLVPVYFLYSTEGIHYLSVSLIHSQRGQLAVKIVLFFLVIIGYAGMYRDAFPRPQSAMEKPSTTSLFQFVKEQTRPDDTIVFFKPRVLALFTGRKSLALAIPGSEMDPLYRMQKTGVSWIVVRKDYDQEYQAEQCEMISRNPNLFQSKFENDDFHVYQFRSPD